MRDLLRLETLAALFFPPFLAPFFGLPAIATDLNREQSNDT